MKCAVEMLNRCTTFGSSLLTRDHRLRRRSVPQPTAGEAGFFQPRLDVRILPHRLPNQIRSIILDHRYDRALVDTEIVSVEPTYAGNDPPVLCRSRNERRIEIIDEPVSGKEIVPVFFAHRD